MPDLCPLLFVYGSLRKGFPGPQAHYLASQARYVGPGKISGRLYLVGYLPNGTQYPGLVPCADPESIVVGDLWEMPHPEALLSYLDRYESISQPPNPADEYERTLVTVVTLEATSPCIAWAYLWKLPVSKENHLPSGDFLLSKMTQITPHA